MLNNNRGVVQRQLKEIERQEILIEALNAYLYLINEGDINE